MDEKVTRRGFVTAAVAGAALAAVGSGSVQREGAYADEGAPITWDYEADMVVVGSGTGTLGAIAATSQGGTAILVEKADIIGGTTIRSGGKSWVPGNYHMETDGAGADYPDEDILRYLQVSDMMHGSTDEQKMDYIVNAREVFRYIEDELGFPMISVNKPRDYYNIPFIHDGRTMDFADPETGEGLNYASRAFETYFEPALEANGVTVLTDTRATSLVRNSEGHVIGITAQGPDGQVAIGASRGVLLAAGGFDWNEEMRRAYLRGPIFGSAAVQTNTGDGIRMGMAVGADLGCMHSTLGGSTFLTDPGEEEHIDFEAYSALYDFGTYRAVPHSLMVDQRGRRFMDEATSYPAATESLLVYDSKTSTFITVPAYLILTDGYVDYMGCWPGGSEERPEWVMGPYATIDELAAAFALDPAVLSGEIDKFNGYCDTGEDLDYGRGEGPYANYRLGSYASRPGYGKEGLANGLLGRVEAPYYVALVAPASLGTKGGLKVNADCQVIDVNGNVIEGLYASGTNASAPLGASYGGAGGGVGPGYYMAMRAVNHCMGLGML